MAEAANITEDYSISDARSGSIRVSRLVLTGWGASPSASAGLKTWSDNGRMWGVFTASTNDFSLRRRGPGVYVGTDEVCSGTVSAGRVTLAADNGSGISGSADVDDGTPGTNPTSDSLFDVIVGYADENDLAAGMAQAAKMLTSSTYPGGTANTRFERLLIDAKRKLDKWLLRNFSARLRYDKYGRPLLAHITRPGDFARCQALIALSMWNTHRAGLQPENPYMELARDLMEQAQDEFSDISVQFDYERDNSPDVDDNAQLIVVRRA